ncbi:hypothetical protein ANCCEY_08528 [Ancylostoma ceylanicum]|uniref:Striatin N-terminal domain-containing protein n=1 Tax=Ancylostoma ceylanicum TaxID=53326 RepID=A0A0D6LJX9_9BILA|nr:hypothetical protein ANCCEY_08528 [Ancylostoma ceylanicum]
MHGVLHFLQHEWSKYEMEKAKWEMERAEMQAVVPNEVDAYVAEGGSALGWKQGRQLLKQYLQVN